MVNSIQILSILTDLTNASSTLLLATLLLYIVLRKRDEMKTKLSYLLISTELLIVMFVNCSNLLMGSPINQTGCRISILVNIYFRNASCLWAGIICYLLNHMIITGKRLSYRDLLSYYLFAFGIPIIPVLIFRFTILYTYVESGEEYSGQDVCVFEFSNTKKNKAAIFFLQYGIVVLVSFISLIIYAANRCHLRSLLRDKIITDDVFKRVQKATRILIGYPLVNFAVSSAAALHFLIENSGSEDGLPLEYFFSLTLGIQGTMDFIIYLWQSKPLHRDFTVLLEHIQIKSMSALGRISSWLDLHLGIGRKRETRSNDTQNLLLTSHAGENSDNTDDRNDYNINSYHYDISLKTLKFDKDQTFLDTLQTPTESNFTLSTMSLANNFNNNNI